MLLAVLALTLAQPIMAQPSLLRIFTDAPAAAQAPCNPDPLKSLGCVAQQSALAADRTTPAKTPMICNRCIGPTYSGCRSVARTPRVI